MTLRRAPVRTDYIIDTATLQHVEEIRDLGVTLDTKLTFKAHVSDVVKRANRSLGYPHSVLSDWLKTTKIR